MQPGEFLTNSTRTVVSFEPNGQRFVNTDTGRIMDAGTISFECGHSYTWFPWALADDEPMPAAGGQVICAVCLEALLPSVQA